MINILCHNGNLLLKLARTPSKSEIFLRPLIFKKSFNQTPHYCSLQFSRGNNLLLSIKILNHAMNHTKFKTLARQDCARHKINRKELCSYQKHLLKQQNVKGNRINAVFFCKTTLFKSFEYVFLIFVHCLCASPNNDNHHLPSSPLRNKSYLFARYWNKSHTFYCVPRHWMFLYTDPFRYQFPSFFFCGKSIHGLNAGFICNTVGGACKSIFPFTHVWNTAWIDQICLIIFFMPKSVPQKPTLFTRIIKKLV